MAKVITFLTPTSVVGDKSGVSLIAHELAHSWSGNLVTNATWRDFWLNEGTTTYLTYRVMDEVFGPRRGDMERVLGQQELVLGYEQVSQTGDKALAYDVRGRDPDEVFSAIPYERGTLFLSYLDAKFGRARFDAFLRGWFDDHAFQSKTTEDFIAYLDAKLLSPNPGIVTRAKVDDWIYSPEQPGDAALAQSDVFTQIDAQRDAWLTGKPLRGARKWAALEWQHFLDNLPAGTTAAQLAVLDREFRLAQHGNAYVSMSWFRITIRHGYEAANPAIEKFLLRVGRMRFLNPLYRELAKTASGREFAQKVYAKARAGYHPIAQGSVDRILKEAAN